jgi:phosphoglycolate phosphatase
VIKAVLFDFDGTLLDTAPDLVAGVNHLRNSHGLPALPLDHLRHFVSRGGVGMIKAGMPPCDDETLERWHRSFLEYYQRNLCVQTAPFDGVGHVLAGLAERDIPWGVVTNRKEYLCLPILEKLGWLQAAGAVICGDKVVHAKPHPEPVLAACRQIGVQPGDALMVGDDLRDMEAGRRAGAKTAFALYGYADNQSQSDIIGDAALLHSPGDLPGLLKTLADGGQDG